MIQGVLPSTIPHVAQAAADKFGDQPCVILPDRQVSFAQVWTEAKCAASAFLAAGVRPGTCVAIWAPNSLEWIIAALGVQSAGGTIVPLNTRLKGREAADQLRRAKCTILLTVGEFLGADYPAMLADETIPTLARTILLDQNWADFLAEGQGAHDPEVAASLSRLTADDISDIIYTSGTTGAPKGAVHTHGRVVPLFAEWARTTDLRNGDRYLIVNPFFHTFGYKAGWVAALIAGAAIVPVPVFDAGQVGKLIEDEKIAFIPGAPAIYQALLAQREKQSFDCSSLRVAVTGAANVPPELVRRMHDELSFDTVVTGYGMTECGTITMCRAGDPIELVAKSCGKAVPGIEVRIVADDGAPVKSGEPGEIAVRGHGVMLGYLDDAAATAEAIDAEGWLRTGDIGTLDAAGYLTITDRKKDMFICGGFNAYPAEVEAALCDHPAIAEAAVIGVPDERLGEVGQAFVVLRANGAASGPGIVTWARANMANYKAPRSVEIVEALPRNASGKVLKEQLRSLGVD